MVVPVMESFRASFSGSLFALHLVRGVKHRTKKPKDHNTSTRLFKPNRRSPFALDMSSSMRSVLACDGSPCKPSRFGFLARKLSNRRLFDSNKAPSQVNDSLPEKRGTNEGAVVRTEKIERALSVANAARQTRQAILPAGGRNISLETLEDKLRAKENRCLELRQKIEAKKQEVPVRRCTASRGALSSSHIASKQRAPVPDSGRGSLQALEAKLLRKEEECANLRQQASSEASKRGRPVRSMADRRVDSMSCLGAQPLKPALQKELASRNAKSVSWESL
jgi:hypothetical protein